MTITTKETQIEVGCTVRGRPSYRWVPAVLVTINGQTIYPPMRLREAKAYVKELRKENP